MLAAAEQHAAHRAHILEIAAEGDRDMLFLGDHIVGRIEVDPAEFGRPDRDPSVGRIRAGELRLALGGIGEKVPAHIARGEAERPQACDFEVREVLADAALDLQHLLDRRCSIGCAALISESVVFGYLLRISRSHIIATTQNRDLTREVEN